jgi:hypothetical protein
MCRFGTYLLGTVPDIGMKRQFLHHLELYGKTMSFVPHAKRRRPKTSFSIAIAAIKLPVLHVEKIRGCFLKNSFALHVAINVKR